MTTMIPTTAGVEDSYPFLLSSAIMIPLSLTALLPNIMPCYFHIKSKNVAASSLLIWIIVLNFMNVLNACIWSTDNTSTWFHGKVLCDIEVRLIIASGTGGLTCATMCLARNLAGVLDTENVKVGGGKKRWVLELAVCWGPVVWFAVAYYAVQTLRYAVAGGYGCTPDISQSWVTIVLILIWPVLVMLVTCWYCGQIIYRLHAYRTQVSSLLARSQQTRSRFLRLFLLAALLALALLVASITQLVVFITSGPLVSYSWAEVHADWNYARLVPSDYQTFGMFVGRYFWIVFGWMAALTVGMGDEVLKKYRSILVAIRVLKPKPDGGASTQSAERRSSWFSSFGSKAKLLFKRNSVSSGSFETLNSPKSSRFSKGSILSEVTNATSLLPVIEPQSPQSPPTKPVPRSKLALFSRFPSFGQAFAGVPPPPIDTSKAQTIKKREAASRILITVPSPTIGGLNDDLILQMVGAEPPKKKCRGQGAFEMEDVEKKRGS